MYIRGLETGVLEAVAYTGRPVICRERSPAESSPSTDKLFPVTRNADKMAWNFIPASTNARLWGHGVNYW